MKLSWSKATIRDTKSHRIIDKVSVRWMTQKGFVRNLFYQPWSEQGGHQRGHRKTKPETAIRWRMVSGHDGIWAVRRQECFALAHREPQPIQISNVDVDEFKEIRKPVHHRRMGWPVNANLGIEPRGIHFPFENWSSWRGWSRFARNNYNLIELGPKGTGQKPYFFRNVTPRILIQAGNIQG